MTDDIVKRLREGIIEHPRRWSGDCHSDLGGSADYEKTQVMLEEAADEIEKLRAAHDKLRAKLQAATGELCDSAAKAALGESDD